MKEYLMYNDITCWRHCFAVFDGMCYDFNHVIPFGYEGVKPPVDEDTFNMFYNKDKYDYKKEKEYSFRFVGDDSGITDEQLQQAKVNARNRDNELKG